VSCHRAGGRRYGGGHAALWVRRRLLVPCTLIAATSACATIASPEDQPSADPIAQVVLHDESAADLIPAGYGSLRQEDVAVRIQLPGVQVRMLPLDESVLRVLSPDSYRALRDLQEGSRGEITRIASRYGVRTPSLWYASYFGLQPDTRISPMEVVIGSTGRDYRPLDVVPLSAGFGQQRIGQREVQSAIYVFEEGINVNQPLVVTVESVRNTSWGTILRTIERERALVRSRATAPR
jgi:hypothetical protein